MERCIITRRKRRGREREREDLDLSDLPEAVLSDIMYKLPVKSIFRFKCVSKTWLSMISDPLFAQSYSKYRATNSRSRRLPWTLLFRYDSSDLRLSPDDLWLNVVNRRRPVFRSPSFTLQFLSAARDDMKPPIIVLAVSNGLLLSTATRTWHDCYYICNPLTKQWSALPKPPRIHKWVSLGFIVEPIDGSFQVVRIGAYQGSSNVVNFEIFSSKTGQWKDKKVSFDLLVHVFPHSQMCCLWHAVPCNKILHWMEFNNRIIAFDTSQQTDTGNDEATIQCGLIDLPSDRVIDDILAFGIIGVCQDHLRYFQVASGVQNRNLSVWELRKSNNNQGEGDGEWFLLHRIRFGEVNPALLPILYPIAFHPLNPDMVYLVRSSRSSKILASLNLKTRVCRNLIPLKGFIAWWTVFAFSLPRWPTPIPQIS